MVKNRIALITLVCSCIYVSSMYAMNADLILFAAVEKGDQHAATEALQNGANVNAVSQDGCTPLALAARDGHTQLAELLLNNKADIHAKGQDGYTPLMWSVEKNQTAVAQLLLEKKANGNVTLKTGYLPLVHAAKRGYDSMAEWLLTINEGINAVTANGWTPLICAALFQDCALMSRLLSKNPAINARDKSGNTALRHSIYRHNVKIVEMLVLAGADCSSIDMKEVLLPEAREVIIAAQKKRAESQEVQKKRAELQRVELQATFNEELLTAARIGADKGIKDAILKGADVDVRDSCKRTALMHAAAHGLIDVVEFLLDKKADMCAVNYQGITPLSFAVANDKILVAEMLLNKKADVNESDMFNNTPLMRAVSAPCAQAVKLLLAHQADVSAVTSGGETSLTCAMANDYPEIVEILIAAGADYAHTIAQYPHLIDEASPAIQHIIAEAQQKGAKIQAVSQKGLPEVKDTDAVKDVQRALEIMVCGEQGVVIQEEYKEEQVCIVAEGVAPQEHDEQRQEEYKGEQECIAEDADNKDQDCTDDGHQARAALVESGDVQVDGVDKAIAVGDAEQADTTLPVVEIGGVERAAHQMVSQVAVDDVLDDTGSQLFKGPIFDRYVDEAKTMLGHKADICALDQSGSVSMVVAHESDEHDWLVVF